jgi:hypothetical protein
MAADQAKTMSDLNKLILLIVAIVGGWLLYYLSPVLMPFFYRSDAGLPW